MWSNLWLTQHPDPPVSTLPSHLYFSSPPLSHLLKCLPQEWNVSDHRYPVCVNPTPHRLVWVTKIKAGDSRCWREVNFGDLCTCLNTDGNLCNTGCGPYNRLFSFHSSSTSSFLPLGLSSPLFSVCVIRQLATSIKVEDLINSHWPFLSSASQTHTQVVLLLM